MIAAAITALNSRTGSSRQAILKYIVANYKLKAVKTANQLKHAIKTELLNGTIKAAKASGKGANSFKLVKPIVKPMKHSINNTTWIQWKIFLLFLIIFINFNKSVKILSFFFSKDDKITIYL